MAKKILIEAKSNIIIINSKSEMIDLQKNETITIESESNIIEINGISTTIEFNS